MNDTAFYVSDTQKPRFADVYSWSKENRNGFPDHNIVMNIAGSFKDGSFSAAPR